MNYQDPYMQLIMTPPRQDSPKYDMYKPIQSNMRIVSDGGGLGDMPMLGGGSGNDWIMPVVVIVVSAMALMTLYAVLSKR